MKMNEGEKVQLWPEDRVIVNGFGVLELLEIDGDTAWVRLTAGAKHEKRERRQAQGQEAAR